MTYFKMCAIFEGERVIYKQGGAALETDGHVLVCHGMGWCIRALHLTTSDEEQLVSWSTVHAFLGSAAPLPPVQLLRHNKVVPHLAAPRS